MTPFVHQSYDKFKGATTTETDVAGKYSTCILLRHLSSPKGDAICLDLKFHSNQNPQPLLIEGELVLLLNGSKRYSLRPHLNGPCRQEQYVGLFGGLCTSWDEYMYYEISKEILRDMAYATSIEVEVSGAFCSKVLKWDEEKPSFLILAKALYNAIFDNSVFNEDFKKEQQRIKNFKEEDEKLHKYGANLYQRIDDLYEKYGNHGGFGAGYSSMWKKAEREHFVDIFCNDEATLIQRIRLLKEINEAIQLYENLIIDTHSQDVPNDKVIYYEEGGLSHTKGDVLETIEVFKYARDIQQGKVKTRAIIVSIMLLILLILLISIL